MQKTFIALAVLGMALGGPAHAQRAQPAATASITIVRPARVFDGDTVHDGWSVRVKGDRIDAVGPDAGLASQRAERLETGRGAPVGDAVRT